jgi:hypothetical protein
VVSETEVFNQLTLLIAHEDFINFGRCEGFRSCCMSNEMYGREDEEEVRDVDSEY